MPARARKATPAQRENTTPAAECNVLRCKRPPTTRGVCDPHYATHRGYAKKEPKK
ncbi:hypothetical protein ACIBF5_09545 [Micromonospora sp. NPDC050417]|uniref:hypothetical protein n=1 Tax=Micromonospora sp. NPDC050417 TaxID=3364280 RepID=UPI003791A713